MQHPIYMMAAEGGQSGTDQSGPKPHVPHWHLWTDENGISHQEECALTLFELKGVDGADPQ